MGDAAMAELLAMDDAEKNIRKGKKKKETQQSQPKKKGQTKTYEKGEAIERLIIRRREDCGDDDDIARGNDVLKQLCMAMKRKFVMPVIPASDLYESLGL